MGESVLIRKVSSLTPTPGVLISVPPSLYNIRNSVIRDF